MRLLNDVTVLDLSWSGPHSFEEIASFNDSADHGVYQIYGTHNVNGPDSPLYIGEAADQTFIVRIPQGHRDWIDWEPGAVDKGSRGR